VIPSVSLESTTARDASSLSFLSSHRAVSVCTRELARLSDALTAAATVFAREQGYEPPTTRRAPDRCIVQLGPVALTAAWLRNGSDSPVAGELMAIVWRGIIAPRGDHLPERLGARYVPTPPVEVWEATYVASAASEATWQWHEEDREQPGISSIDLAAVCMEQLRQALADTPPQAIAV
jgi:hypothetical protein